MSREIRFFALVISALLLVISALLLPSLATAQAPPPTKAPVAPKADQLDPNACARSDTQTTVGKGGEAQIHRQDGKDDLSEKLARSGGVICPPEHVDPEIRQPTPPTGGSMPVIPPPGSPGGDQSIQPK
jgi:hypothetical protein